jgi:hypothetical protein
MPFILNEDKALKELISNITVSDSGNPTRPVGVWFGQPDPQIRQQSYPYITIDLVGVSEAKERVHTGFGPLSYTPEGVDPDLDFETNKPIAINLDYQVTTYSRQPRHDRQLMATLLGADRLPFRFGVLVIPEDNTVRRLDMLGFSKRDTTEGDKRLFSNVFMLQISSEILRDDLVEVHKVLYPPTISYTVQDTDFTIQEL